MNRAWHLPLVLVGGLLAAQTPAFPPPDGQAWPCPCPMAQPGPMDHPEARPGGGRIHPGPGPAGPMADFGALALSPDQMKAARAVLDRHRATTAARHRAVAQKEEALRAALEDPATSETRLRALHGEAAEAEYQSLLDRRAMVQELDALLTPEQRAKAARIRTGRQREREAHRALMEELGEPGPVPPPAQP